jgi:uncharacterized membrane protein HdeD (DUF308 family)
MVTRSGRGAAEGRPTRLERERVDRRGSALVTADIAPSADDSAVQHDRTGTDAPLPVIGLMIGAGIVTALIGVAILAWPEVTLTVVAVLLAIHLFVAGVTHIAQAVVTDGLTFGSRALLALSGALCLLVGLLVLRSPLQTVSTIALLFGALLVLLGVFRLIDGFRARPGARGWELAAGALCLLVGGFVMSQPELSLRALVSVVGLWQIALGLLMVVAGLALRKAVPVTDESRAAGTTAR